MNGIMNYKGYTGSVEFSEQDQVLFGKVLGIRALLSYEGETVEELIRDFHESVDGYLEMCAIEGEEPETPYKGSFNVRIKPEVHKEAVMYAMKHGSTLNKFVEESIVARLREERAL